MNNLPTPESKAQKRGQAARPAALLTDSGSFAAQPMNDTQSPTLRGESRRKRKSERLGTETRQQNDDTNDLLRPTSRDAGSRLKHFPQSNPLGFRFS